jgi:hypothetical protein
MERPGLLEFAVYALVLAGAGGWVYALPPFTHEPDRSQSAEVQPAEVQPVAATASSSAEQPESASSSEQRTLSGEQAPVTKSVKTTASAATPEPDDQTRLDPKPNLLVVTATRLNMRSAPHARSQLVGSYARGAVVEEVSTNGNWVLVRTVEDDSMGWMYAGHLGAAAEN